VKNLKKKNEDYVTRDNFFQMFRGVLPELSSDLQRIQRHLPRRRASQGEGLKWQPPVSRIESGPVLVSILFSFDEKFTEELRKNKKLDTEISSPFASPIGSPSRFTSTLTLDIHSPIMNNVTYGFGGMNYNNNNSPKNNSSSDNSSTNPTPSDAELPHGTTAMADHHNHNNQQFCSSQEVDDSIHAEHNSDNLNFPFPSIPESDREQDSDYHFALREFFLLHYDVTPDSISDVCTLICDFICPDNKPFTCPDWWSDFPLAQQEEVKMLIYGVENSHEAVVILISEFGIEDHEAEDFLNWWYAGGRYGEGKGLFIPIIPARNFEQIGIKADTNSNIRQVLEYAFAVYPGLKVSEERLTLTIEEPGGKLYSKDRESRNTIIPNMTITISESYL